MSRVWNRGRMATDPRSSRRYQQHRAAGLARIQALHRAGQTITCVLCTAPLDPFQPYAGGRNPLAPTLEHTIPLAHGGPLYQPADRWAHKGCQSTQGAQIRNARSRPDAQGTTPRIRSRDW